jgi:heme-degrading monooxygenase HmoA
MSVLVLFRWEGNPDQLLAAYDKELEHPVAHVRPRRISHTCARADDGMVIVDVWHSREDFQKMRDDPEFQKNLQAAGYPSEPQLVEVYEVHAAIP